MSQLGEARLEVDPEVAFVWHLIDRRFTEIHGSWIESIDWQHFNWKKALLYAQANSVLYQFCQEVLGKKVGVGCEVLKTLNSVIENGKKALRRLLKTLLTIKDLWDGKVNYYIIKTRDDRPTYDADVFFSAKANYESAIRLACNSGYRFVREEPFKGWIDIEGAVKVELHHGISWFGMKVIDTGFLADNPRDVKLMDLTFQTISKKAECALDFAHWIMDIQPLTISSFSKLAAEAGEQNCLEETMDQAKKYGWIEQLVYHLSVLRELCNHVYSCEVQLPIGPLNVRANFDFPFWAPIKVKVPFMAKKILKDNNGFGAKMRMLQLSLRRYAWSRLNFAWIRFSK